jgi:hypothetical protein
VIVAPSNTDQWLTMAAFLQEHAGVQPSPDLKVIGWVSEDKLVIVVGFNGWLGSLANMHVAYAPNWHFTPRQMLRECFRYAFITAKREMLLGIVNSKNIRAMRMDIHLGFTERFRLPGLHDDGGDLVLFGMAKDECIYHDDPAVETETAEAGHA